MSTLNVLKSFDADVWATEFLKLTRENQQIDIDQELMRAWFANALMRGWDEAHFRSSERKCIWTPLPDVIDAYEGCASIHHVGRDDEGPELPAFCPDCGGAVVLGSANGAPEQQSSEPKA